MGRGVKYRSHCYFCGKVVSEFCFCYGCREYICSRCDETELTGRYKHKPEDHKKNRDKEAELVESCI